jgi:hypothetical protein
MIRNPLWDRVLASLSCLYSQAFTSFTSSPPAGRDNSGKSGKIFLIGFPCLSPFLPQQGRTFPMPKQKNPGPRFPINKEAIRIIEKKSALRPEK